MSKFNDVMAKFNRAALSPPIDFYLSPYRDAPTQSLTGGLKTDLAADRLLAANGEKYRGLCGLS